MWKIGKAETGVEGIYIVSAKTIEVDRVSFTGERIEVDIDEEEVKRVDRTNRGVRRFHKIGKDLKEGKIANGRFEKIVIAEGEEKRVSMIDERVIKAGKFNWRVDKGNVAKEGL